MSSAANLKFLSVSRQVRYRNFKIGISNSTPPWNWLFASAPLIPKFASEVAAVACELPNRSSSHVERPRTDDPPGPHTVASSDPDDRRDAGSEGKAQTL